VLKCVLDSDIEVVESAFTSKVDGVIFGIDIDDDACTTDDSTAIAMAGGRVGNRVSGEGRITDTNGVGACAMWHRVYLRHPQLAVRIPDGARIH